jgi:outer membrane protein OmpA-like peptidoglycan-associated protein
MTRLIIAVAIVAACAHATPKPPELDTLETLRRSSQAEAARKHSPDLVGESDRLQGAAKAAWKKDEIDSSRGHALLGWIKLKLAIANWEQDETKRRMEAADADLARSDKELARLTKELTAVQEQIALLEKLSKAKSSAEAERIRAEQEKLRGDTQSKIAAAELALKTADTVEAATYAKSEYQAAADLLGRAQAELKEGNAAAASTTAELAKVKAEQATATARPEYMKVSENKDRKVRDEALGRDAAALSGITVRLDRQGDVARLVLTYAAFKSKATQITPGKDAILEGVAQLLKKYPTYPVQLIGHTDGTGGRDANLVLSQARAQAVYNALISKGIEAKRFVVSGLGATKPVGNNRTAAGRDQNNRVEIVLLYQ